MMTSARGRSGVLVLAAAAALHLGCTGDAGPSGSGSPGAGGNNTAGHSGGGVSGQAGSGAGGVSTAGAGGTSNGGSSGSGTGGAAGAAGAAGTTGGAGGSAGIGAAVPSVGCGMDAGQALNSWVEQPMLTVNGKSRQWWVWLPTNYNPTRAYPIVFTLMGCGQPDNIVPMQKVTGADAIVVHATAITANCWTYGATGEDVMFFDAMLADAQAKRCVDTSRVFIAGYSSGSWLANTLACVRGDKIRGIGTVSGGVANKQATNCKGEFARIFIHDLQDIDNKFVEDGDQAESGRIIAQNHCMAATPPVPEAPVPCARYQGCDAGYPVIMCLTMNKMHDREDNMAPGAFWGLFSKL